MNVHKDCRHVPLGYGALLCPRTRLAYIRPDLIPTPTRFKVRPDEWRLVFLKTAEIKKVVPPEHLLGFAIIKPTMDLPRTPNDYADVTAWLRDLLDARKNEEAAK